MELVGTRCRFCLLTCRITNTSRDHGGGFKIQSFSTELNQLKTLLYRGIVHFINSTTKGKTSTTVFSVCFEPGDRHLEDSSGWPRNPLLLQHLMRAPGTLTSVRRMTTLLPIH